MNQNQSRTSFLPAILLMGGLAFLAFMSGFKIILPPFTFLLVFLAIFIMEKKFKLGPALITLSMAVLGVVFAVAVIYKKSLFAEIQGSSILPLAQSNALLSFLAAFILYFLYIRRKNTNLFTLINLTMLVYGGVLITNYLVGHFGYQLDFFYELFSFQMNQVVSGPDSLKNLPPDVIEQNRKFFAYLMPSLMTIYGGITFFFGTFLFFRFIYKRKYFHRYNLWFIRIPTGLIWIFIAGWAALLYLKTQGGSELISYIIINVMCLVGFYYLAQGVGIISFFARYNNLSPLLNVVVACTLITMLFLFPEYFIPLSLSVVFGMGLFDQWFNYRKI